MELAQSYPTVHRSLSRIALEAGVLSNMVDSIRNTFPMLFADLSHTLEVTKDIPVVEIKYSKDQKFVTDNLHTKQYLDLAELNINIPEGFNGKLTDYATVIGEVTYETTLITEKVLKPYMVYLSQFLSNKDAKISTKDQTGIYKGLALKRESNINAMDHYRSNGTVSISKLGKLVNRKEDIVHLFKTTNELTKMIDGLNIQDVKDCVKKCVDLLGIIIGQTEKGLIENVTPEVVMNLAFGAAEIAREVEFLAIVHFRAIGLTTCVDNITEVLKNNILDKH